MKYVEYALMFLGVLMLYSILQSLWWGALRMYEDHMNRLPWGERKKRWLFKKIDKNIKKYGR